MAASGMPWTLPLVRGFRGVDVGVGVEPDESDALLAAAIELGQAGDGADTHGVVAADRERHSALAQDSADKVGVLLAGGGDLLEITGVQLAGIFLLGEHNGDIAAVFDDVAESFQLGFEAGDADGRRPHVDPAALLAEIERNADHLDGAAGNASERCGNAFHDGSRFS